MAGNDHHRLCDEAESFLLHDRGGEAEGFPRADSVGDISRAEGDDPPDDAFLVGIETDHA